MTDVSLLARVPPLDAAVVQRFIASHPVKVGELAKALGIEVKRAPMQPRISGLIQPSTSTPSGFEIKVNKYEVPERQRFTVAHEIAHYLLHRESIGSGVIDNILYRSGLTSKKEVEANRLAADIVMPAGAVSGELRRLGGLTHPSVVEDLAAIFRVSVPAMKVRLGLP